MTTTFMLCVLLGWVALGSSAECPGSGCTCPCNQATDALDELTTEMVDLDELMSHTLKVVKGYAATMDRISMSLDKLEGGHCNAFFEFNCRGRAPSCIAYYLVCDGANDCPNGEDEQSCDMWLQEGQRWRGTFVNQRTNLYDLDYYEFTVPEITSVDFFPGQKTIDVSVPTINHDGSIFNYPMRGVYHFGEHALYWRNIYDFNSYYGVLKPTNADATSALENGYLIATAPLGRESPSDIAYQYYMKQV